MNGYSLADIQEIVPALVLIEELQTNGVLLHPDREAVLVVPGTWNPGLEKFYGHPVIHADVDHFGVRIDVRRGK